MSANQEKNVTLSLIAFGFVLLLQCGVMVYWAGGITNKVENLHNSAQENKSDIKALEKHHTIARPTALIGMQSGPLFTPGVAP